MVERQTNLSFLNATRMTSVNQELRRLKDLIESKLMKGEGIRDSELTTHLGTIIASMDETMDQEFKQWVVRRNELLQDPLHMLRVDEEEEMPERSRAKSTGESQTISLSNVMDPPSTTSTEEKEVPQKAQESTAQRHKRAFAQTLKKYVEIRSGQSTKKKQKVEGKGDSDTSHDNDAEKNAIERGDLKMQKKLVKKSNATMEAWKKMNKAMEARK